jgi:GAF domain-containing protein
VGVLFVNFRHPYYFTSDRKEKIRLFANQAALAIRNARAFSQIERFGKERSVLNEIGKAISSAATLNNDEILNLVYKETATLMDVTNFYIAFYQEQNNTVSFALDVRDSVRHEPAAGKPRSRKAGSGLTEYVIHTKKPLLIKSGIDEWLRANMVESFGRPAKSWLGVPMITGQKVLGVIAVQNYDEENAYDEGHRDVLLTIASQTAIAIDKARLFDEDQKRIKELSALYDTSKEIAERGLDVKLVLQAIVRRAVELSNAQAGTIFLCDHARQEVKIDRKSTRLNSSH